MKSDQQIIIREEGSRLWAGRLYHHLQMSNSTNGNARIPAKDLKLWSSEVCPDKDSFFSYITSSQQEGTLVIPCPVPAVRCSFHVTSSNALMPVSVSPSTSVPYNPRSGVLNPFIVPWNPLRAW